MLNVYFYFLRLFCINMVDNYIYKRMKHDLGYAAKPE